VVLAGATFAEKAGSYVNADGRLQYAEAALPPRDGSLPDLDLLAILLGRGTGPISSRQVLAELGGVVPAFAAVAGGKVPAFGVLLGQAPAQGGTGVTPGGTAGDGFSFTDPWNKARGAAV
jgi:NADH-quinone oxidoreductase subunit G